MSTSSTRLPARSGRRHIAARGALLTLLGIAPVATIADQYATGDAASRVADVSLSDLDLSKPEGRQLARERLQAMAERLCAEPAKARGLPTQANFASCVNNTVAVHLKQIDGLRRDGATVRNSLTRAANVSLADLDLSTLEGARAAHERLETMARRLCTELARLNQPAYQVNYPQCVRDTLAGALAQANMLAPSTDTRTARRATP